MHKTPENNGVSRLHSIARPSFGILVVVIVIWIIARFKRTNTYIIVTVQNAGPKVYTCPTHCYFETFFRQTELRIDFFLTMQNESQSTTSDGSTGHAIHTFYKVTFTPRAIRKRYNYFPRTKEIFPFGQVLFIQGIELSRRDFPLLFNAVTNCRKKKKTENFFLLLLAERKNENKCYNIVQML